MRTALRFITRTLAWTVILAAGAVILASVLVPRLTGSTPYTILTGSMEPTYPPGTLVVVRPVNTGDLSVGDVVTVQLESGKETVVTHRIVAIQYRADGAQQFITQGDANEVPDDEVRLPVQIRGEVWYSIPYLGYVSTALSGSQRNWVVTVIAIGLIGYAGWMFVGALRERRSRRDGTEQAADGDKAPEPAAVEGEVAAERAADAGHDLQLDQPGGEGTRSTYVRNEGLDQR